MLVGTYLHLGELKPRLKEKFNNKHTFKTSFFFELNFPQQIEIDRNKQFMIKIQNSFASLFSVSGQNTLMISSLSYGKTVMHMKQACAYCP